MAIKVESVPVFFFTCSVSCQVYGSFYCVPYVCPYVCTLHQLSRLAQLIMIQGVQQLVLQDPVLFRPI